MIRLSIIIPVYNMEEYLPRCLDSVCSQKYSNLEIIIVDDGSTDYSLKVCRYYADRDSRIKVIHKNNEGLVAARKTGLGQATGEYVTYVDSDDWIEEGAYEGLMEIASEHKPSIIACSFIKEYGDFNTLRMDYPDEGYYTKKQFENIVKYAGDEKEFFCQVITGSLCCKIIKKDFLEKYQNAVREEITLGEDIAVTLPMLANAESIYVHKRGYYHYCQNKTSMCWERKEGNFGRLKLLVKHLCKALKNSNESYKQLMIHTIYFTMMDQLYDVPKEYFEKEIPFLRQINKDSRVVVYGKGSCATNLIDVMKSRALCDVILNVDSGDAERLFTNEDYDYVIIAILDYMIVEKVSSYLIEKGIEEKKIVKIDKSYLTGENLPEELRKTLINYSE